MFHCSYSMPLTWLKARSHNPNGLFVGGASLSAKQQGQFWITLNGNPASVWILLNALVALVLKSRPGDFNIGGIAFGRIGRLDGSCGVIASVRHIIG